MLRAKKGPPEPPDLRTHLKTRTKACSTCSLLKKKCTYKHSENREGSCDRCIRNGTPCGNAPRSSSSRSVSTRTNSPVTSPEDGNAQISPTSTTASLLTTQLSLSLSYHCISLCFQHQLVPGLSGLATVDATSLTNAFRTRSLDPGAEPEDLLKNDLFAMLCFFQGAKISNHSAIIGPVDVPSFNDYPFALPSSSSAGGILSSLGARRLDVILALHDQVSALFDELIARSRTSLQARIERVILTCLVIWSTFNVRRMAWMHARTGEALKAGVKLLKEMKAQGVPAGIVMSSLSDLAGCHYMVAGMFAMPPMLTEEYLSISDPNVPTLTEMTSHDEMAVIFDLRKRNIDVPPTMTHLHLTLQEAIISSIPLHILLPKTWKTVDTLLAFINRLFLSLSPEADDYPAMVQHIVTRELSYLGLEIICFKRLWYMNGEGMEAGVFEKVMMEQRERLVGVTPKLVEGVRLLLSLDMEPARSLDSIWLVNNMMANINDCGIPLEEQLSACTSEQLFALRQGIRLLAFTDEAAIGTLHSLERMADEDPQTYETAIVMVDGALQQLGLEVGA